MSAEDIHAVTEQAKRLEAYFGCDPTKHDRPHPKMVELRDQLQLAQSEPCREKRRQHLQNAKEIVHDLRLDVSVLYRVRTAILNRLGLSVI